MIMVQLIIVIILLKNCSRFSGLTVLVNVKMIEMANQIKEGGLYCSQTQNMNSNETPQFLTVKECEVRFK